MVGKPNLVKCFGPRLRLWTWTLDFVPGPSFSIVDVDSWWTSFKQYTTDNTNLTSWEDLADPEVFPMVLSDFLFDSSGSRYKANFRFDGDLVCNRPTPTILVSNASMSY